MLKTFLFRLFIIGLVLLTLHVTDHPSRSLQKGTKSLTKHICDKSECFDKT